MKLLKAICVATLVSMTAMTLTGCESKNSGTNSLKRNVSNNTMVASNKVKNNESVDEIDYKAAAEKQMALPNEGEEIAIMHVKGYGDISFKFFPEVAPKAVENFLTHSRNGYYNGLTFHRIINEFMIQGGDPEGTGMGGESIWGTGFGPELDKTLVPYRGTLCMAMSSLPNSIGSQFFITQANYNEMEATYLKSSGYSQDLIDQYKIYGGSIYSLFMKYTVFGQVYEGMDVVDKIAQDERTMIDNNGGVLKEEQPVIESIEVTTYKTK